MNKLAPHRLLDPWTLALVVGTWSGLSAISFLESADLEHRPLFAWLCVFGLTHRIVAGIMVADALLLFCTLSNRSGVALRTTICFTSSALWVEFGFRTLTAGISVGDFVPRGAVADIACGLMLAMASVTWPFFRNSVFFEAKNDGC